MRMTLALAALTSLAAAAQASPLVSADPSAAAPAAVHVHHKPGHQGGPPWTRGRERGYDDRRSRAYEERYEERRVSRCVTRYEERYDPYRDAYVRRPVRLCD